MQDIADLELLNGIKSNGALLILFGGEHCSVCQSLRPQLDAILKKELPDMRSVYVDCKKSPDICAQHSVFSLPVVKAYIEGMLITEQAGSFSVRQLIQKIERSYTIWKESM